MHLNKPYLDSWHPDTDILSNGLQFVKQVIKSNWLSHSDKCNCVWHSWKTKDDVCSPFGLYCFQLLSQESRYHLILQLIFIFDHVWSNCSKRKKIEHWQGKKWLKILKICLELCEIIFVKYSIIVLTEPIVHKSVLHNIKFIRGTQWRSLIRDCVTQIKAFLCASVSERKPPH